MLWHLYFSASTYVLRKCCFLVLNLYKENNISSNIWNCSTNVLKESTYITMLRTEIRSSIREMVINKN